MVAQYHTEQRLSGNLQGQFRHLAVEIDRRAGGPTIEPVLRQLDRHFGITGQPAVLEDFLDQPPLSEPEIALAVDQAVAVNFAKDSLLCLPFAEASPLCNEDLADEIRVVDHVTMKGSDANVSDISIVPGHLLKKR